MRQHGLSLVVLIGALAACNADDAATSSAGGSGADNFQSLELDAYSYFARGSLSGTIEHDAVFTNSSAAVDAACSVAADPADISAFAARATAPEVLAALAKPGACQDTVDGSQELILRLRDGRILGVLNTYGCPADSPLGGLADEAIRVIQKYCPWAFSAPTDGGG
jgi:hypothetical protein